MLLEHWSGFGCFVLAWTRKVSPGCRRSSSSGVPTTSAADIPKTHLRKQATQKDPFSLAEAEHEDAEERREVDNDHFSC